MNLETNCFQDTLSVALRVFIDSKLPAPRSLEFDERHYMINDKPVSPIALPNSSYIVKLSMFGKGKDNPNNDYLEIIDRLKDPKDPATHYDVGNEYFTDDGAFVPVTLYHVNLHTCSGSDDVFPVDK